jgi:maltose/moltooligosaccharide transporter
METGQMPAVADVPAAPEAGRQAGDGSGLAWRYSLASLGAGLFYGFNNATLPLILSRFTDNALLIGLMSSTRSIEGTIVQPLIGGWSDRTWTRLGRRRPFMAIGIPLSALFFILAAHAPNLVLLVAAIVLFSLLFNAAVDPYNALLADLFPPARRSAVTGLAKVIEFAGTVGVVLAGGALAGRGLLNLTLYLVAIGMLLAFAATIATVREPRVLPAAGAPAVAATRLSFREQAAKLLEHRAAFRLLVCLFCYRFGGNAIQPYLTLFAIRVIGTDERIAQYLFVTLALGTGLLLAPAGLLASRRGRRPVLALGIAVTAVAALAGLVIRDVPQTIALALVAGAGNAAITATDWPLLSELVPPEETGVFAGLKTAFESVAIPVSVVVSSALIHFWGYRMIFVVLAIGAAGALALLPSVGVPAKQETPGNP